MVARFALRCARAASGHAAAPPSSVMKLRRPIIRSPRRLANADIRSGSYLPSFQISAASFQSPPIFSHTTRYLPVTSFGIGPLVLRLKVPISRAAEGPSGLTSRVVSFGSLNCSAMLFHSASIAALLFTMPSLGGNAVASSVLSNATPTKSPLLKKSIHFAFTVSISAFWANAGIISPTTKAIASAIVRMTHDSCDVRFAPYASATRPILPSALRWQNDTEYNALVRTHLSRSADVSATIGRDHVIDLVVGNRRPNTVHFNFVVIANDATLGRPTIDQIAARTSVVSSELRVEALMPFIVARTVVSLLRRSVHTKKQGSRAAERDELAGPHSITSSARASKLSGTVSPSAFAVLRLITVSYFVGACTGRSAGFSPLRMRST